MGGDCRGDLKARCNAIVREQCSAVRGFLRLLAAVILGDVHARTKGAELFSLSKGQNVAILSDLRLSTAETWGASGARPRSGAQLTALVLVLRAQ